MIARRSALATAPLAPHTPRTGATARARTARTAYRLHPRSPLNTLPRPAAAHSLEPRRCAYRPVAHLTPHYTP